MACFLVPVAEAIITTVVTGIVEKKENEAAKAAIDSKKKNYAGDTKISFSRKLKWLSNLLWGDSFLLAFEHIWHGEVTPWFPFLTAAGNPADTAEMLHEMATVGVSMAVLITAVWLCMTLIVAEMEKKTLKPQSSAN